MLCVFLLPFCLTDDFPLFACQVQCLFNHILSLLGSRPPYPGQISLPHVTFSEIECEEFSGQAIICLYLYLVIIESDTHQWVQNWFYLLYNYYSVNLAKPPQNTNTTHEDSAARVRLLKSLDRTPSLLLHYSCFLSNFSDISACDCWMEMADTVPGTSGCRCGSETWGGIASLASEDSGALTPSSPLQSHALPATSCVLDCLQQGVSISKCGKHKTENTCIFNQSVCPLFPR